MTNDEIRMTKESRSTNAELVRWHGLGVRHSTFRHSTFGHSSFFRHSCFDIRNSEREREP